MSRRLHNVILSVLCTRSCARTHARTHTQTWLQMEGGATHHTLFSLLTQTCSEHVRTDSTNTDVPERILFNGSTPHPTHTATTPPLQTGSRTLSSPSGRETEKEISGLTDVCVVSFSLPDPTPPPHFPSCKFSSLSSPLAVSENM